MNDPQHPERSSQQPIQQPIQQTVEPRRSSSGPGIAAGIGAAVVLVATLAGGMYLGSRRGADSTGTPATTSVPTTADNPKMASQPSLGDNTNGQSSTSPTDNTNTGGDAVTSDAATSGAGTSGADATSANTNGGNTNGGAANPGAAAGKTIVKGSSSPEAMTISVNGTDVGDIAKTPQVDVTSMVKPGLNTLRVAWSRPLAFGTATVGYAPPGFAFGKTAEISLSPQNTSRPGNETMTFLLPNPADATSPTPVYGSADNQTILKAQADKTLSVYLNGRSLGDFASNDQLDISKTLKPGSNTLRVVWKRPIGFLEVRVAHAAAKDVFGTIATISPGVSEFNQLRRPGERSVTFNAPA